MTIRLPRQSTAQADLILVVTAAFPGKVFWKAGSARKGSYKRIRNEQEGRLPDVKQLVFICAHRVATFPLAPGKQRFGRSVDRREAGPTTAKVSIDHS